MTAHAPPEQAENQQPLIIDVLTLFPGIVEGPLRESMMKRAEAAGLVEFRTVDVRDFGLGKHRQTDDTPTGGGPGMVMKPEPLFAAVESVRTPDSRVLLMTPGGRPFRQHTAWRLSKERHLIMICGHYEGVDHRVVEALVDEEISIGDYVLTNGALAACVVIDAVTRLIPGVLGHPLSAQDESFAGNTLEAPQYTKPQEFRGMRVPDILLSGNHAAIDAWRKEKGLERTREVRPDLLDAGRSDDVSSSRE
jgi:tRNA (guanine37-N1)-methyltransferase